MLANLSTPFSRAGRAIKQLWAEVTFIIHIKMKVKEIQINDEFAYEIKLKCNFHNGAKGIQKIISNQYANNIHEISWPTVIHLPISFQQTVSNSIHQHHFDVLIAVFCFSVANRVQYSHLNHIHLAIFFLSSNICNSKC